MPGDVMPSDLIDGPVSINGVAVDPARWPTPELAAVRELLRQRAIAVGLLDSGADAEVEGAAIETLLEREVPTPEPGETECRRFYNANPEAFRSGDLVFARHILFQITPGAQVTLVREQAEQTLAQLLDAPDDFATCALTLSNCPSGRHGGNLGQIGRGDTVAEFEQALFADRGPGILPELVKTRFGFHIVAVDRRVAGELLPFEAVRDRVADMLRERVERVAISQYVRLLAGRAEVHGVELGAVEIPLLQ